jgi:hypothetical protein
VKSLKFSEYLKNFQPGESILIEHSSLSPYPYLFYIIGRERNWEKILAIDILDSALPIIRWLKAANLDIPLDRIDRVKAGGTMEWGNKVIEVDPHKDPGIFMSRFLSKLAAYYRENKDMMTFVLNPERLIPLQDNRPSFILYLANVASELVGNPSRIVFYFLNFEITHRGYLALLEESFTRVLRLEEGGKLTILKSINTDEEGRYLELG